MEVVKDVYNGWNDNGDLEEIKKCPFCGGIGILQDNGYEQPEIDPETGAYIDMHIEEGDVLWCECEECGATAKAAGTPEEAVANWNMRAEQYGRNQIKAMSFLRRKSNSCRTSSWKFVDNKMHTLRNDIWSKE